MEALTHVEIALITAIVIFIIALFLTAKQWISFSVTLLLLLFALGAGFIIAHQDSIKDYLSGKNDRQQPIDEKVMEMQKEIEKQQHKLDALEKELEEMKKKGLEPKLPPDELPFQTPVPATR